MDCGHLSIECAPPPGYLADRRSGFGYGSPGSKAPSPASVARAAGKNVGAVASLARRRCPALLASLFEQAWPAYFGDFALAGQPSAFYWRRRMSIAFSRRKFLALTSGALAVPSISLASNPEDADDDVPALLDHILLGSNDLDRGIELLEEATGVSPASSAGPSIPRTSPPSPTSSAKTKSNAKALRTAPESAPMAAS